METYQQAQNISRNIHVYLQFLLTLTFSINGHLEIQGSTCKSSRGVTTHQGAWPVVLQLCPNIIARNTTGRTCPPERKHSLKQDAVPVAGISLETLRGFVAPRRKLHESREGICKRN